MDSRFITLESLAARLWLPRTYLRRLAIEGAIPYLNVNGALRFEEDHVREALRRLAERAAATEGRS